ncbi:MAG: hypothetical protein HQ541_20810, partial [Mariniphaga sp.]|nr:hypothetical protein [Mariniphaga sp.]
MKRLLFALVFVSILYSLSGQNIKQWAKSKESVLYEKVYLHIDRELYSTGDTIWFKSYLVSGMTNKLITGYKNIYVQLVSPNGEVVSNSLLLSVKGESKGDITIPDSLHDGQYVLRAYTKYLENFGEESFFHKRIWISEPKSSLELDQPEVETKRDLDVMFFPEGGNLILNAVNHVAFKAVNKNGKGIDIKGEVVDEQGNLVTSFHTDFMGMGRFVFMPNEGKTYYAKINGHPDFQFQFENILDNGFTINFSDEGTEVLISIIRNIKRNDQQKAYFAAMHKGVVLFHKELEISNFNEVVKLQKNLFPLGISKISLLDLDFNIIAERLVFISDGILNSMEIGLNKEEFSTREQVKISINSQLELTDT